MWNIFTLFFYVLGSSSIWKCRIQIFEYLFWFFQVCLPEENNNKKFQSSTCPNRWATKDITFPNFSLTSLLFFLAFTKLWKDKYKYVHQHIYTLHRFLLEIVFQFRHFFYSMAVVYTDLLRRAAETHGPDSPGMLRALRDIDDVLQAKLKDIKAKADHKGQAHNMFSRFLNVQIYKNTKFSLFCFSTR